MVSKALKVLGLVLLLSGVAAWAAITGSISGVVKDPSGAVIPGVEVTALNTQTGIRSTVKTDAAGFYNFPVLPIGSYDVEVRQTGFRNFRETGLAVNANSALRVDIRLEVGEETQLVTVSSAALHVETRSTQMGEVIGSSRITAVPLNGRSFTDLLALQPGVSPYTNAASPSDRPVSGSAWITSRNSRRALIPLTIG